MGRLAKKKVDKIFEMLRQNYTAPEIVDEVGCSASTVNRYRKNLEKTSSRPLATNNFPLFELLFDTLLSIIIHIEMWLDQETQESPELASEVTFWRSLGLDLLKQIAELNPTLFKTLVDRSEFPHFISNVFSIDLHYLTDRDRRTRCDWIDLLTDYYPEKLRTLIN
jgi:hypothetical protein